jgi:CopA family copper-resistance protein
MSLIRSMAFSGMVFFVLLFPLPAESAVVEYDLTIMEEEVNFTGKPVEAMTINGGIPGPTLGFTEGDIARVHVHNKMMVDTSIHWHGLLVPPDMDGVPYISFPPISPGSTFTYEFPIRQSGTYWYHSHTGLQEQRGVYGSIVIRPRALSPKQENDHVILLSDWTDEDPHHVLRTLKRGSEWYALQKGSAQSILGAARLNMLHSYVKRELQRMPPMDIADVAYDRFLANGKSETTIPATPGETARLRIIDGSSTTYFHLEFAGGPLTIVSADGQDVEPVNEQRFLIGVAETYDVLVNVPASGAYEFRATAHDGSGYASVWIGSGKHHPAPDVPKPNLYHSMGDLSLKQIFALTPNGIMGMPDCSVDAGDFDRPCMMDMGENKGMEEMNHHAGMAMGTMEHTAGMSDMPDHSGAAMDHADHSAHRMDASISALDAPPPERSGKKHGDNFGLLAADASSAKHLAMDGMDPSRPWPPYAKLRATRATAFTKDKPVREIRLTLDGDMKRYVWFLNNKPLSESDSIRIREGDITRFIMINRTMMHHPMHLHGHFFRIINGQGDYAPLKHTVDVAPMSTTIIEFDANEFGDWFFHCHLLYHMESGMARVVHYEGFEIDPALAALRHNLYMDPWFFRGEADVLSNMSEGFLMLSDTRNIFTADWEVGWQKVDDTEWEAILTWDRYINRFLSVFAGADLEGVDDDLDESRAVLGVRYLLPFSVESSVWLDSDGEARVNLERAFQLTPRIAFVGEAQYDTEELWEGAVGLSYMFSKSFSLKGQWHSDYGWGGGVQIRF